MARWAPWKNIQSFGLETPLDHALLKKMSTEAASGVQLQCSRKYWEEEEFKIRATQLHKLKKHVK